MVLVRGPPAVFGFTTGSIAPGCYSRHLHPDRGGNYKYVVCSTHDIVIDKRAVARVIFRVSSCMVFALTPFTASMPVARHRCQ